MDVYVVKYRPRFQKFDQFQIALLRERGWKIDDYDGLINGEMIVQAVSPDAAVSHAKLEIETMFGTFFMGHIEANPEA